MEKERGGEGEERVPCSALILLAEDPDMNHLRCD